ncbi:MAG TPA: TonB family protein [Cytophagales bacterium]|nr:TonB family protein [Cytophagales bacterium]
MNTTITDFSKMDDLVFENRNIAYGAYSLRNKYEKHLYTGLLFTFGIFALGMGIPEFIKNLKGVEQTIKTKVVPDITLTQPPPLTEVAPPPAYVFPTPPPPPSARFIPTATNEIVPETEDVFINAQPEVPIVSAPDGDLIFVPTDVSFGVTEAGLDKPAEPDTFYKVEQMPNFNGDLGKFLRNNLKYPEQAQRMGIEGKVFLSFIVGADGSIRDVKVIKGINKELDDEAIRVIKKMPSWNPGKQSGVAVSVHYALPINFKLNN